MLMRFWYLRKRKADKKDERIITYIKKVPRFFYGTFFVL